MGHACESSSIARPFQTGKGGGGGVGRRRTKNASAHNPRRRTVSAIGALFDIQPRSTRSPSTIMADGCGYFGQSRDFETVRIVFFLKRSFKEGTPNLNIIPWPGGNQNSVRFHIDLWVQLDNRKSVETRSNRAQRNSLFYAGAVWRNPTRRHKNQWPTVPLTSESTGSRTRPGNLTEAFFGCLGNFF